MVSRDIPNPVKRQLRQESGFGCCVCGHPFIEYHHIIEFADKAHHNPADVMTLCPIHHHQATVGALQEVEQRKFKDKPHNIEKGNANGMLYVKQSAIAACLGGNEFVGPGFKVLVDGESLLELGRDEDDQLLISVSLYDEDDNLLLLIQENEWVTGDVSPWDFEFGYRHITFRSGNRDVSLTIDARKIPVEINGKLWRSKQNFILKSKGIKFNGVVANVGISQICLVNSVLEVDTKSGKFYISPHPDVGEHSLVPGPDTMTRTAHGLIKYHELLQRNGIRQA